jgi:hypothetical protein
MPTFSHQSLWVCLFCSVSLPGSVSVCFFVCFCLRHNLPHFYFSLYSRGESRMEHQIKTPQVWTKRRIAWFEFLSCPVRVCWWIQLLRWSCRWLFTIGVFRQTFGWHAQFPKQSSPKIGRCMGSSMKKGVSLLVFHRDMSHFDIWIPLLLQQFSTLWQRRSSWATKRPRGATTPGRMLSRKSHPS